MAVGIRLPLSIHYLWQTVSTTWQLEAGKNNLPSEYMEADLLSLGFEAFLSFLMVGFRPILYLIS